MLDTIIAAILEKGGLGYALFLGAVFVASRVVLRGEAREGALRAQVAELQAARVGDVEKKLDSVAETTRELVEALTGNKVALESAAAVMQAVVERLPADADVTQRTAHAPPRRLPPPR